MSARPPLPLPKTQTSARPAPPAGPVRQPLPVRRDLYLPMAGWSVLLAIVFVAPFGYLIFQAIDLDVFGSDSFANSWLPLRQTFILGLAVSVSAAVVGTALAWLIVRTDLPAARIWAILAPLPLAFPSFVGATALIAGFSRGGFLEELLSPLGIGSLPSVYGFWGAWAVLTFFTYPYVYLPVQARLSTLPASFEESARMLGRRPLAMFASVVLPQAWTAISAGGLLVFLYTISDFGAVSLLRHTTLTRSIFSNRLFDQTTATAHGLLLAVLAFAVIIAERFVSRRGWSGSGGGGRSQRSGGAPYRQTLGRWRWPTTAAVTGWMGIALVGPLVVMGYWVVRGFLNRGRITGPLALSFDGLWEPTRNTLFIGVVTAAVTVVALLPLARLTARYRSRLGAVCSSLVLAGFALPGLVIALAFVFWVLRSPLSGFYQSLPLLVLAYSLHFGAQATRVSEAAVETVPRQLEEVSHTLGVGRWRRFLTVDLSLMAPGLLAGGGLILLSTMKELPITLLLHPIGFDTLAIRIWADAEELAFAQAGLSALVLVGMSAVLTWLLILRRVRL